LVSFIVFSYTATFGSFLAAGVWNRGLSSSVLLERGSGLVVVVAEVDGFRSAAAAKLRLDRVPLGLHPFKAFFFVMLDFLQTFSTGRLTREQELELHGEVDGGDLTEENGAEEDGHDDESDAVLHVGDEETVQAGGEGEDAKAEHEGRSDIEVGVPEIQVVDVVVVHEEQGDAHDDDGADCEEGIGEIDELLVLGRSPAPRAQTQPTRSSDQSHDFFCFVRPRL